MIEYYDKQKFENNLDLNILIIYESFEMREMIINELRKNCTYNRKISDRQYEIGCMCVNFYIFESSCFNDGAKGRRYNQIIIEENANINKDTIDFLLRPCLTKRVSYSNKLIDLSEYYLNLIDVEREKML